MLSRATDPPGPMATDTYLIYHRAQISASAEGKIFWMRSFSEGPDADRGVYGISVAAELVGMGVQTLRLYETRGLLEPDRTDGGTRRYATNDLHRLRRIGELVDAGLNIAGIAMVLDLEAHNAQLLAEKEQTPMEPTTSALGQGFEARAMPRPGGEVGASQD